MLFSLQLDPEVRIRQTLTATAIPIPTAIVAINSLRLLVSC